MLVLNLREIREVSSEQLFKELRWSPLTERWTFHKCLQVFRCIKGFCPSYLLNLFSRNSDVHNYNTRDVAINQEVDHVLMQPLIF